jgi:membrane dipeptidase
MRAEKCFDQSRLVPLAGRDQRYPMPRLIFDSHLDLAWSAIFFNRDLTLSVDAIRARESSMSDERARGKNVLSFPELRRAGVVVCVATVLARGGPDQKVLPTYKRTDLDYAAPSLAYSAARGQLAYYELLESQGLIRMVRTRSELSSHWAVYSANPEKTPLGIILSMEGTDPIVTPEQARHWHGLGLRAAGLAHYGRGQHAYGTGVTGPLNSAGIELLRVMDELGMILDVTHLCDESMAQGFEYFDGRVLASHHNCRALVPGDRQLTDEQIKQIIARGGVIGAALDAWMLYPNWIRGETKPDVITLKNFADHIDHVCQIAGNAKHSALGTDLDGGFGNEQTPIDLRVYADLQKLAEILLARGYSETDVDGIFHGNWLRFFMESLPG